VSDIDTAVVDSLKVLDLKWPIREADIAKPSEAAQNCDLIGGPHAVRHRQYDASRPL
jgi:hypothetical protein